MPEEVPAEGGEEQGDSQRKEGSTKSLRPGQAFPTGLPRRDPDEGEMDR